MTHLLWPLAFAALLLAGCAPRATLVDAPTALDVPTRTVFVRAQRALDPLTLRPDAGRDVAAHFQSYDITLPPLRTTGQVSFPKGTPDPDTDMLVRNSADLKTRAAFRQTLAAALRKAPEREVMLFVHGYNNTYADGVLRTAQMAQDFDQKGVTTHFSWASAGHPLAYVYDRESIMTARGDLQEMIEDVTSLAPGNVTLVAHSVGADLTMEVLRDIAISGRHDMLRKFNSVVLISPDIDVDVFKAQARRIGTLPDPFLIITSQDDRALTVSARLTGNDRRVGNLTEPEALEDFNITLIDVSALAPEGDFLGHFTAATSPTAIALLQQLRSTGPALEGDLAARPGLIPGTISRTRALTRIILGTP